MAGELRRACRRLLSSAIGSGRQPRGPLRQRGDWAREGWKGQGFTVRSVFAVKEFNVTAVHLEHDASGAAWLHVDTDDVNNVFAVLFRTPATDSTGVSHILEHTVLCGSEKYPVREVFFNMTKRSLNTFMNAMTSSDYTVYPFSTRNAQDFENLMNVYMDATFFPLLNKLDFQQEGHRLERASKGVERVGVVYNEMKGSLGSASSLLHFGTYKAVLPGTNYANVFGGDPPEIARLTHERLVEFHKRHYHPSNAMFYSFGDLDLENHLRVVDSYIAPLGFSETAAAVRRDMAQSRVTIDQVPKKPVILFGPQEPMLDPQAQADVCISRTTQIEAPRRVDPYDQLVQHVLSVLLLDGPSAPLYAALIDSGIAPAFSSNCGLDNDSLHPIWTLGAHGVAPTEESKRVVLDAILDALTSIAENGPDPRRVEAVVHQLELSVKQRNLDGFGLTLLGGVGSTFARTPSHERKDLIESLNECMTVDEKVARMQREIAGNPRFWQDKVVELFLEPDASGQRKYVFRKDFIQISMHPKETFSKELEQAEQAELANTAASLSSSELEAIDLLKQGLEKMQAQTQNLDCLPSLTIADIPRKPEEIVRLEDRSPRGDRSLLWVADQATNGLAHAKLLFDCSHIPDELLPLLSIFTRIIGNIDAGGKSYQELSIETDRVCGGMSFWPSVSTWLQHGGGTSLLPKGHSLFYPSKSANPDFASAGSGFRSATYRQCVGVSIVALQRNWSRAIDLLGDVLTTSDAGANVAHLENLLDITATGAAGGVTDSSLSYARKWSQIPLGVEYAKREALSGISQVELMTELKEHSRLLVELFPQLLASVFRGDNMAALVHAGGADVDQSIVQQALEGLRQRLPHGVPRVVESSLQGPGMSLISSLRTRSASSATYFALPAGIHNVSVSIPTAVHYGHQDAAAMSIIAHMLNNLFLFKEIREKGGAYGSGASQDSTGVFDMYSYYDPNCEETLRVFAKGCKWICEGRFERRDIDESLLAVFGSVDAPKSMREKGEGEFTSGITHEQRQAFRDRFFSLQRQDLVDAATRHLGHVAERGFVDSPLQGCVGVAGKLDSDWASSLPNWTVKNLQHRH